MMDEKKICFISCINDQNLYNEALYYINQLEVPQGYEIECISVENAESMAQGYNKAMEETDAKYKVYLHQDVYIINKMFIRDILGLFQNCDRLGMLGIAGVMPIPANGIWNQAGHKCGKVYDSHTGKMDMAAFEEVTEGYKRVHAVDGLIIITQYDIPWREDIFNGWCFYDMSQSIEYRKAGYYVAVPKQEQPWVIHDCGLDSISSEHEYYRKIFLEEYPKDMIKIFVSEIDEGIAVNDEDLIEWRSVYAEKNCDKSFINIIDSYLINKLALDSEKISELFEFDKIKAMQSANSNRKEFFKYIDKAKNYLNGKNYEQASRWCFEGAKYASENHPGFYMSPELEEILLECARNLPNAYSNMKTHKQDGQKRRVLHILSEGYSTGGHTRLVKNWIEKDKDSIHSLVATWQIDSTPDWLIDSVKESGGWTYSLQDMANFIDRAANLRKIAYEWADIVVMHVHMFDPIPIMAFGIEGGPPILFMNHGDHVFWIGTTIIDNLVNFRPAGKELSINRRGVPRNSVLPMPLSLPRINNKDKDLTRKSLGIKKDSIVLLTIATPYKFKSFGKIHYIDILKKILAVYKNVSAIVIGPGNEGAWKKANRETKGRLLPMGIQHDIEKYYAAADIYIDSYMLGSVTSALDAGLHRLPVAALQNYNNKTLSFNDISYQDGDKEVYSVQDYINFIGRFIKDKNYREEEGKKLSKQIEKDHIVEWKEYLNSIYQGVENKAHKIYLHEKAENKLCSEDLFLALFQSKETVNHAENEDYYIKMRNLFMQYFNEDKFHSAQLIGEYLVDLNSNDYDLLNALAVVYFKKNKTWMANRCLSEAIKHRPESLHIALNYIKLNRMEDIKTVIDKTYAYHKDNEEYLAYYNNFKNYESFNALFENKKYAEALRLYNSFNKLKARLYKVSTIKEFCIKNDYKYYIAEEKKQREIFVPKYFGSREEEQKKQYLSPEIYVAELKNVNIIGESSIIIADDYCLYDMARRDNGNRLDLRFASLRNIDGDCAIVEYADSDMVIEEAVFLIGFASYNYYHLTVELLSRLQYIDSKEEYRSLPLLVDEAALKTPQYSELLKVLNKFDHPVIPIRREHRYKVKKLIYPSYNTWMPINVKAGKGLEPQDFLISSSAVEYIRSNVLRHVKSKGCRKIFISRKNSANSRLINEENVIELFKQYGFEIICPEDFTFQEQVELFSDAEYIAGATGAAFTNIIYCPENAKIMCIIPQKYNFYVYSTISNMLNLQCIFLDAAVVDKKKAISSEVYEVDLNYCEDCLKSLNLYKNNNNHDHIVKRLEEKINYISGSSGINSSWIIAVRDTLHKISMNNKNETDTNEYFERLSHLKYFSDVINESASLNDGDQINIIFNILYESLKKIRKGGKAAYNIASRCMDKSSKLYNSQEAKDKKVKIVFLTQAPSVWPSTESVWKAFKGDDRCEVKIVQLPFIHDSYTQTNIGQYLADIGIQFILSDEYDIKEDKPDVVFFQNPYDSTRPYQYSFEKISNEYKTAYIPYGLEMGGGKENIDWQFNLPIHQRAWKVFARSERHKKMFQKYCSTGAENVVVTGHPKLDGIFNLETVEIDKKLTVKIQGRRVIFWNPHFSVDQDSYWSTFFKWKDTILNLFEERKDIVLLVRPHPLLFERLKKLNITDEYGIDAFRKHLEESDNIILDESEDYRQAFLISDGIMTDAGSFLLEYLPTKKPIMYLPNDKGPGLNDDGELVNYYYLGLCAEDIRNFVDMVAKGKDPMFNVRTSKIEEYLTVIDGKAGERIKDHIIDAIKKQ